MPTKFKSCRSQVLPVMVMIFRAREVTSNFTAAAAFRRLGCLLNGQKNSPRSGVLSV